MRHTRLAQVFTIAHTAISNPHTNWYIHCGMYEKSESYELESASASDFA